MANGKKKNEEPKNETVEKRAPSQMVGQAGLPAHMRGLAGLGTEKIGAQDVETPRIKLLQALSPEVQEGGHRQGTFYHSVAEENLGASVQVVVVYADQAFILWRPRKQGGGILARAMDGVHWTPPNAEFDVQIGDKAVKWRTADTVVRSGLAEWGSENPSDPKSPPAATRMYNCVVCMPDHPELSPVVVTMQRAAIRVARKLMGKLKLAQAPAFGLRFIMESERDQSPAGEFWNYRFVSAGLVDDPEEFKSYQDVYELFKQRGLKIRDIEGLQTEAVETPTDQTAGAGSTQGEKY